MVSPHVRTSRSIAVIVALAATMSFACSESAESPIDTGVEEDAGTPSDAGEVPDAGMEPDAGTVERAQLTHDFGGVPLRANEEITPCISWTLNNDQAIYVENVSLSNGGWFHHSNWFVVPEDTYAGPDGLWNCRERDFTEVGAALQGTVLFAQSTQAQVESQSLGSGVTIKVPPRHKVVGSLHLLNLTPRPQVSQLIFSLDIVHPRDVRTVVAPFRLLYGDLEIAPRAQSRFTAECDFAGASDDPLNMKLYYLLPHYHELGNYFRVEVVSDDARNGQVLLELDGFNAQPNGKVFDPPIELNGIRGFKFTCGYDNPRDEVVRWGIGDQEMCEALALADTELLYDARNSVGTASVAVEDGVIMNEGPCQVFAFDKNPAQAPPTAEEIDGPFYVPPTDPADEGIPPILACEEPDSLPSAGDRARLSLIQEEVLQPGCTFSSCHDALNPAAGLDLRSDGLFARIMGHTVAGNTDLPLVDAGNPEGSWLYQRVAQCEPRDRDGAAVARMPFGSATLMDAAALGQIRDWIANGAQDD